MTAETIIKLLKKILFVSLILSTQTANAASIDLTTSINILHKPIEIYTTENIDLGTIIRPEGKANCELTADETIEGACESDGAVTMGHIYIVGDSNTSIQISSSPAQDSGVSFTPLLSKYNSSDTAKTTYNKNTDDFGNLEISVVGLLDIDPKLMQKNTYTLVTVVSATYY